MSLVDIGIKLGIHHVLWHISCSLILGSSADIITLVHKLGGAWILSNRGGSCKIRVRIVFDFLCLGDLFILLCNLDGHLFFRLHRGSILRFSLYDHIYSDIIIVGISITTRHILLLVKNSTISIIPHDLLRVENLNILGH